MIRLSRSLTEACCPVPKRASSFRSPQPRKINKLAGCASASQNRPGTYFRREDAAAALFREWSTYQGQQLHYSKGDTWDRILQQGIQLLDRFCQDDRIRIRQPRRNLQIKFTQPVSEKNDFVAYVDAIG